MKIQTNRPNRQRNRNVWFEAALPRGAISRGQFVNLFAFSLFNGPLSPSTPPIPQEIPTNLPLSPHQNPNFISQLPVTTSDFLHKHKKLGFCRLIYLYMCWLLFYSETVAVSENEGSEFPFRADRSAHLMVLSSANPQFHLRLSADVERRALLLCGHSSNTWRAWEDLLVPGSAAGGEVAGDPEADGAGEFALLGVLQCVELRPPRRWGCLGYGLVPWDCAFENEAWAAWAREDCGADRGGDGLGEEAACSIPVGWFGDLGAAGEAGGSAPRHL